MTHKGKFLARLCDVSLPVPLDQAFTYSLPLTGTQHRVQPGSRLIVPFGTRKMTGVVLRVHDDEGAANLKDALRLIDEQPVLDGELLALGEWIAGYYCAPLGEVLRSMLPLASDIRAGKVYSLTDSGRDAARQLSIEAKTEDAASEILRMLSSRSLSAAYLQKKLPLAARALKEARAARLWIAVEETRADRDPLRAAFGELSESISPAGGRR